MRSEQEMLEIIMNKAKSDERIRAVAMDGSRANENATHDSYSDFDIVYYVTDIREFTNDKTWIKIFGDILIVQCPDDWYSQPYDYNSHDRFAYLIQLADGNRIDLTLIDIRNITHESDNEEPRIILLNKDNYKDLIHVDTENVFYIESPTEQEFCNTCNEFRWLSIYISKGLCREEFYYARYSYEVLVVDMFMKMLNWKIGIDNNFGVTTGLHSKYLKRYLSESEMERVQEIFPNGTYKDMWKKLFLMYDYFAELEDYVAEQFGFIQDVDETRRVRGFIEDRYENLISRATKE